MKKYQAHRYADIVPEMTDEEFKELKSDIEEILNKINEKNLTSSQRAMFAVEIQDALEKQQYEKLEKIKSKIKSCERKGKKRSANTTNVYFIQSTIGGPVKIGRSKYPYERLEEIQRMSPFPLEIIYIMYDVPISTEKKLHKKFKGFRMHGEWFENKVLNLMADLEHNQEIRRRNNE